MTFHEPTLGVPNLACHQPPVSPMDCSPSADYFSSMGYTSVGSTSSPVSQTNQGSSHGSSHSLPNFPGAVDYPDSMPLPHSGGFATPSPHHHSMSALLPMPYLYQPFTGLHQLPTQTMRHPTMPTARRTLTDDDRRRMCLYHQENPHVKQTEIGAMFGVERSTVSKVLRRKEKYLSISVDEVRGINSSPRSKGKFPDVERTLANFIRKHRHEELSDETIKEKAMAFANSVGIPDITRKVINSVWLEDFRRKVLGSEPSPSPSSASAPASHDGDSFDADHELDELNDGGGSLDVYRTSSIGATSSTASFSSNSDSSCRSTRTLSPISMMSSSPDEMELSQCSIASDSDLADNSLEYGSNSSSSKYNDEIPMKKRCLIKNEANFAVNTNTTAPSSPSSSSAAAQAAATSSFSSTDSNPAPTQEGARIGLELVLQYFNHHASELTTEDYAVIFKLLGQLKDKAGYDNTTSAHPNLSASASANLAGMPAAPPLSVPAAAVSLPTSFPDLAYKKRTLDMI